MSDFFLSLSDTLKVARESLGLRLIGFSTQHILELQHIAFYYSVHTTISTDDAWHIFYEQAAIMAKIGIPPFEILIDIKKYAREQKPAN